MASNTIYPNITFEEDILAPQPTTPPFRNTCGVVGGDFKKGPPLARVRNYKDLAYLFGADATFSSTLIQHGLAQGLNDFVVSRAFPTASNGKATLTITTNGVPAQARTDGSGETRTVGLEMFATFLQKRPDLFSPLMSKVESAGRSFASGDIGADFVPLADGAGSFEFVAEHKVDGDSNGSWSQTIGASGISVAVGSPYDTTNTTDYNLGEVFYFTVDMADDPSVEHIKPGFLIKGFQDGGGNNVNIIQTDETYVASLPRKYTNNLGETRYTFLVQTRIVDSAPTTSYPFDQSDQSGATVTVEAKSEGVYALGVRFNRKSDNANLVPVDSSGSVISDLLYKAEQFPSMGQGNVDFCYCFTETVASTNEFKPIDVPFPFYDNNDVIQHTQVFFTQQMNPAVVTGSTKYIGLIPSAVSFYNSSSNTYDVAVPVSEVPTRYAFNFLINHVALGTQGTSDPADTSEDLAEGTPFTGLFDSLFGSYGEKYEDLPVDSFDNYDVTQTYNSVNDQTDTTLVLETAIEGEDANEFSVQFGFIGRQDASTLAPATDIDISGSTSSSEATLLDTTSQGAISGVSYDSADFFNKDGEALLRVRAVSPGESNIEVTVTPHANGRYKLTAIDRDSEETLGRPLVETYELNNRSAVRQTGLFPSTQNSRLIRAFYLPEVFGFSKQKKRKMVSAVPARSNADLGTVIEAVNSVSDADYRVSAVGSSYLTDVPLTGGSESNQAPSEEDYVDAVKRLAQADVVRIALADKPYAHPDKSKIVYEMLQQCQEATPFNGLRRAAFYAPRNLKARRANYLASGGIYEELGRYAIVVYGHCTFPSRLDVGFNRVPPLGAYLGYTLTRSPHFSPASISGNQGVQAVSSVETPNDPSFLNVLAENHIDALYLDPGTGLYRFLHGWNLSPDGTTKYVSVEAILDQIKSDLFTTLSYVRSQNNTPKLRSQVASQADTYLEKRLNDGWLISFRPTIADRRNNSDEDILNGRLNIKLDVTVAIPTDDFEVTVTRNLQTDLLLQTAA